jgi:AcrR family transcriptional regulator
MRKIIGGAGARVGGAPKLATRDQVEAAPNEVRQPLSRELIIETALEIVDREDLDALTMRRLAGELGVAATALYWHLRTRDEILKGVYDLIVSRIEPEPLPGSVWIDALKEYARDVRNMHREHPFMFALAQRFPGRGSGHSLEMLVANAHESGFDIPDAVRLSSLFQTYAIGFAFVETTTSFRQPDEDTTSLPGLVDGLGADAPPQLLALLYVRSGLDTDELFELGLECIGRYLPTTLAGHH